MIIIIYTIFKIFIYKISLQYHSLIWSWNYIRPPALNGQELLKVKFLSYSTIQTFLAPVFMPVIILIQ